MNIDFFTNISLVSALAGSLIGSIITGFFTLKATKNEFKNQKLIFEENNKILRKTILQSIHDEIEAIYNRYTVSIGNKIASLKDRESLNQYYPISDDFFMFYRANTIEIGKLEDNELRKLIIETYILAKSLIESLKINNNLLLKYEKTHQIFLESQQSARYLVNQLQINKKDVGKYVNAITSQQEVYEKNLQLLDNQLKSYGHSLQKIHFEFEEKVKRLLRKLHNLGVLKEN